VALAFCLLFGGLTASVAAESGIDIFTVASFAIVLMIPSPCSGANPPRR
jgi:hypothetical protein